MWTLFWIVSGLWNFSRGEWRACGEGHRQLKDVREADLVSTSESRYRHRFPIEVVEECVWLYFRFALSYRNIEEMMAKRGVPVTPPGRGSLDEKHKADQPVRAESR